MSKERKIDSESEAIVCDELGSFYVLFILLVIFICVNLLYIICFLTDFYTSSIFTLNNGNQMSHSCNFTAVAERFSSV